MFPIKLIRRLNLLYGTLESPPGHPHMSRRTLLSLQACEIARCSRNQLEITPDSSALAPEKFPVSHHTRRMACLPLGNYRYSLRHTSQVYGNINFSTRTRGKLHAPCIVLRTELIPRILLNRLANFPQVPQEEHSLSNRYVRGTLSFLPQWEWIPRSPD